MRLLAAAILLSAVPAPAQAASVPCGPAAATTVASGALTRAYRGEEGRIRVCTRGTRRTFALSYIVCRNPACRDDREIVRIAGRLVVYAGHAADGSFAFAETTDARTGRSAIPAFQAASAPGGERQRIGKVVLGTDGALALTVRHEGGTRPDAVELRRSGGCGAERLDDGPGIDPGSVRLRRGARVEWRRDGVVHRARACPTAELARRVCPAAAHEDVLAVSRSVVALDRGRDVLRPEACAGRRLAHAGPIYEFDDLVGVAVGASWMATWVESCGHDGCVAFLDAVDPRRRRAVDRRVAGTLDPGSLRIAGGAVRWTSGGAPQRLALPPT